MFTQIEKLINRYYMSIIKRLKKNINRQIIDMIYLNHVLKIAGKNRDGHDYHMYTVCGHTLYVHVISSRIDQSES